MKASWYLLLSAALCVPAQLNALNSRLQEEPSRSESMKIGYTDGNMSLGLGLSLNLIVQGAIEFPQSYTQRLKGAQITSLRVAIADDLTQQDNYVFITDNLDGPFLYKQAVEHLQTGWNDIPLDVPYEIDGPLFIGFKYVSASESLSMDGREDNNLANWIRLTQKEDDTSSSWQHQSGGNLNLQAIVEGDNLPQHDVQLQKLVAKKYAQAGGAMPVSMVVSNQGAANISTLQVSCTVEGSEPQVIEVTDLDIASGEVKLVSAGNIAIDQAGIYNLDVEIGNVNGLADEYPDDNKATVENLICKKEYVNRKSLLEHFSTMNCSNCPGAHRMVDNALAYRDDVIHVVHHAGMGTDPLTIQPSLDYMVFYTDGSDGFYYAPAAMLDRTNLSSYGANDGSRITYGPVFFPQRDSFSKLVDQSLSGHAFVSVDIAREYDPQSRTVSITVSGLIPSADVSRLGGDDIRLNIFVTEDGVTSDKPQAGAAEGTDYVHNGVMRQVLTDTWGATLTFNPDGSYISEPYTYTIPEESDADKMHIVAFLSKAYTGNPNDAQICNANETDITGDGSSGLAESLNERPEGARVFANDATLHITGDYTDAAIFNISGQKVKAVKGNADSVSLSELPRGIYVVRVNSTNGVTLTKIIR